jgi:hypothetical protein
MTMLEAHVPGASFIHPCSPFWAGCALPGYVSGSLHVPQGLPICASVFINSTAVAKRSFQRSEHWNTTVHLPQVATKQARDHLPVCRYTVTPGAHYY